MSTTPVKGPASYFPSIVAKYGQPIAHWQDLIWSRKGLKHMELVAWLKADYGLGHGHANALVADTLAQPLAQPLAQTPAQTLAQTLAKRPDPSI